MLIRWARSFPYLRKVANWVRCWDRKAPAGYRFRGRAYRSPGLRECGTGRGHPLRHPPSAAFGSSSRSRRCNGTGWGRNGWAVQGRLNRSPPLLRRAGHHGQARRQFDTRHAPSGWRQALPCACPVPPAGGHGELVFPAVDSAGRSVGAGRRNRPCVTRLGIAPARGRPRLGESPAECAARGIPPG